MSDKLQSLHRGWIMPASRLAAGLMVLLFALIYWYAPLPDHWNDTFYYAAVLLASWLAAGLGTLVWRSYKAGEPARRVWGSFAAGLWAWALGEAVWLLLRPFYPEFPDFFITDAFWLLAYVFFGRSIFYQAMLIFQPAPARQRKIAIGLSVGAVAAVVLLTLLLRMAGIGQDWTLLGLMVYAAYPVGDVLVGGAGLYLARLFGRGIWGRAWWGLVAFALSDGISFWYSMGGEALISEQTGALLSLFVDTLYFGAYLLFALACLSQVLLLKAASQPPEI